MALNKKEDDDGPSREVVHRYKNRLTIIKNGKDAYKNKEYASALRHYNSYLGIIADFKQIDVKKLHPSFFDQNIDAGEIFLVSQIYWDLCKLYDRSANLSGELEHCLKQFSKFSIGYKFQGLNASMVRKYTKGGMSRNKDKFENAYKQIFVQNKKCYVASHCYSEDHQITESLRNFRNIIIHTNLGQSFTEAYYKLSPSLIEFLKRHPHIDFLATKLIGRPFLKCLAFALQKFKIIK